MPTLNEIGELVRILEETKGFSRDITNKMTRLHNELEEADEELERYKFATENNLAEELVDCIFFIASALSILRVDADSLFMSKWEKNVKRTKDADKLDGFK